MRGMTLLELLVVIIVLSLVIGISYHFYTQARERAYLTTCVSNLRQIIQAVHMYEQDWGAVPITPNYPIQTPEGLWGLIDQLLYPYTRSKAVFICPSDPWGGRWRPEFPNQNPVEVFWKGEKWFCSYPWFVNEFVVSYYGKGNPRLKSTSPLTSCPGHKRSLGFTLIAHYDGSITFWPLGRPRFVRAEFESEEGESHEDVLDDSL